MPGPKFMTTDPFSRSSSCVGTNHAVSPGPVEVSGHAARQRGQLPFVKQAATEEKILLLQLRQRATRYEIYIAIGVAYAFGAIYNYTVNTRFGSGI